MKYQLTSLVFVFIFIITIFGITPLEAQEQVVKCQFTQSSYDLLTGQCHGIPSRPSMPDPNPVDVELRPEDGGALTWTGTMEINGTGYDLEVAPYEYADTTMHVVRTPFGWFIPSTLDLQGCPPELAFSLDAKAPPSQTDTKILARTRELLSNEEAWDSADDRECSPSDTTYSLYCALAEATRIVTGGYQHRQPALQVVRRTIEKEWPERIEGHRLMNFNNDLRTTYDDLKRALDLSEERLRDSHSLSACNSTSTEPTLIVENGRVIIGNGTVLEQASVVVDDDSIYSVTQEPVEAPEARRIDVSGKTILPGLIDAHVHLTIPSEGRDSTAVARHLEKNVPGILRGFLEHGITTVRSTGSYWPSGGQLRDRIADGELDGPRIMTSGPVFTPEGGHPAVTVCVSVMEGGNPKKVDPFCRSHLAREVKDTKQAREAVSELAEQGVDFIKLASDTVYGPKLMQNEVIEAITDQANKEGLKAVGHVYEADLMRQALKAGLDGFVHPPFPGIGASIRDDKAHELANLLSKTNAPVTTTQSPSLFFTSQPLDTLLQNGRLQQEDSYLKIFAEEDASLVVGSDWCPCYPNTSKDPHSAIRAGAVTITEMQMLRWGGMSRETIIEAATVNAARALDMSDQVGTLERGKLADLIVVDGNPLEDLSALENVDLVVQGGEIVTSNSEY